MLDAVHAQPDAVVTDTLVEPAAAPTETCSGEIAKLHDSAWVTTNGLPPIVSVPCRDAPVCPAAVKPTDPFPEPLAPEVTVSQLALLVAVHPQPLPLETLTEPLPPAAGTFCPDDDRRRRTAVPCCTVNVWPPAVIAPLRGGPPLAAAVKRTVPLPVPLPPDVMVIHGTADEAVQPQPPAACTLKVPWPPASSMFALVAESENVQPSPWLNVKVRPAMVSVPLRAGPVAAPALTARHRCRCRSIPT